MPILAFLIGLAGATMLLLYAVRMVGTGIERAMGPSFRRLITEREGNRLGMALMGVGLAVVLQSATAAALLAGGFAASGLIAFSGALSLVLGADFGSALVIQILTFKLDWLIPVLLTAGGYLFLKTERRVLRQSGRILLGIALILLSLRLIGQAVHPIRDSAFLPTIAAYLTGDFVTAFIAGAVITFLMHSSVAAILMVVTFVSIGVLPVGAAASVVLGANLGSATLPIWLSRGMAAAARRMALGNLVFRGAGAIVALMVINLTPAMDVMSIFQGAQQVVSLHLTFNVLLLVAALPCVPVLAHPLRALVPDEANPFADANGLQPASTLDATTITTPTLALASLTREVLRMSEIIETMARPVMDVYEKYDDAKVEQVCQMDKSVNQALVGIRRYAAAIPRSGATKEESRRIRELTEYAINLETAGDIISQNLMDLAREKENARIVLSRDGWQELRQLHERVLSNMSLAFNVLVSADIESARLLVSEKAEMKLAERKSRKKHLNRLRKGSEDNFESSDLHLETLRWINDLNSQISAVAYPILYRGGQLLETRLVHDLDEGKLGQGGGAS
ncbi:MAG: Na/Pi cotransporter family protein [Paracoccaceae bacterium]